MEVPETARKRQKRTHASRVLMVGAGLLLGSCLYACNLNNPGVNPPHGVLSYPIALTLGEADATGKAKILYVVNSNFNLKYNAGSVQAYDLDAVDVAVDKAGCERIGVPELEGGLFELSDASAASDASATGAPVGASGDAALSEAGVADAAVADAAVSEAGVRDAGFLDENVSLPPDYEVASKYGTLRGILCDGRDRDGKACCLENDKYLVDDGEIKIDSYAAGVAIDPKSRRLYIPVRGRDRLVYVDTDATGALSCGTQDGRCTRGADSSDKDVDPDAAFAAQPRALTVGKLKDILPMPMLTAGDPTFIVTVHQRGEIALLVDDGGKDGPVLHSSIPGFDPFGTGVALNPTEKLLYTTSSAFGSSTLHRYGVTSRGGPKGGWLLYPTTGVQLLLEGGYDIRDLRVDDVDPMRLFVLMRANESVLFVERDPTRSEEGRVTSATRVGAGPSKLTRVELNGRKLLFASCFDARSIFVIDETSRELISVVRGLAGPFDMVVDAARQRMYVADFRANVLRVVDVKGLSDARLPPPRIIATLGTPFGRKLK